jgi:hypothetical protein
VQACGVSVAARVELKFVRVFPPRRITPFCIYPPPLPPASQSNKTFGKPMAFFSDGNNEYFSLNLNPAKNDRSLVYELSNLQIWASQYFVQPLLLLSIVILVAITGISGMEFFGFTRDYISDSNHELLVVALAGAATVIAFSEVGFFIWIKKNRLYFLHENRSKKLGNISIMNTKSWMCYLIFLLNMVMPFISMAALPGGLSQFFSDTSSYGSVLRFLLAQLVVILSVFLAFLFRRIFILLFKYNCI